MSWNTITIVTLQSRDITLTPWSRDVGKNFKDAQQVRKFPVLHELRRFFIVSRTTCQWSLSSTTRIQ
jgi:hypothetical protein